MSDPLDPRITPARPDIAAAHLEGQVAAARFVVGARRGVTAPTVPLRRQPRPDMGFDTELLFGETFTVYDTDAEGWSWGQAEWDGYVGWLPSLALSVDSPAPATHKVVALRTFVFPGPSTKLPPLAALPFGACLAVGAREGAFAAVDGGFVWAGHLAGLDHLEADPVSVAERFVGVPYLWGGKSSLGLDCSGLVQTALRACGRKAPRDSDLQERALGASVDPDGPLRRGDLVFWRGHVGLMRDAATFVHSTGHTMTVIAEAFDEARARIRTAGGGEVTRASRLAVFPSSC